MKGSELILPESQEEAVVQQFVDASREIVPTVEVSLAKRIVRPGSGRVLCLTAHTSVPVREDDIATVQDLALRLSDGTNVRLSLSFFNDAEGAPVIPLTRSIYNPNRYRVRSEPKLATVFALVSVLLAAAVLYLLPEQRARLIETIHDSPLVEQVKRELAAPVRAVKQKVESVGKGGKKATSPSRVPHTRPAKPKAPEGHSRAHLRKRSKHVARPRKRSARAHSERMLVPPPPPAPVAFPYASFPYGVPGMKPLGDGNARVVEPSGNPAKGTSEPDPVATRSRAVKAGSSNDSAAASAKQRLPDAESQRSDRRQNNRDISGQSQSTRVSMPADNQTATQARGVGDHRQSKETSLSRERTLEQPPVPTDTSLLPDSGRPGRLDQLPALRPFITGDAPAGQQRSKEGETRRRTPLSVSSCATRYTYPPLERIRIP